MIKNIPDVIFKTRVRDNSIINNNAYRWQDVSTDDYFKGKRVILFSLPGAFTPTCSNYQLPEFDNLYDKFKEKGIDEIYCLSVNDAFVMNAWAKNLKIKNVKVIPDGSGEFTRLMGMLVKKDNLGLGLRSWRYAALINDRVIEKMWIEKGKGDDTFGDSYELSSPKNLMKFFKQETIYKYKRIKNVRKQNSN